MKSKLLTDFETGNKNVLLDTFKQYNIDIDYLKTLHSVPERYYHNWDHIDHVIYEIEKQNIKDELTLQILLIAALYHDVCYDTHSEHNEINSAKMINDIDINLSAKKRIGNIILFTQYKRQPQNTDEEIFLMADLAIFKASEADKINFELNILKEYNWVPLNVYITERIKVLNYIMQYYDFDTTFNINWLLNKKWNIGVYAGSFDPLHIGHMDIINQAKKIFDKVIIVKSSDERIKSKNKFDWKPEYGTPNKCLINFETHQVEKLITDNLKNIKDLYGSATLIRGLRNGSDLQYEQNYLQTLREIDPTINFVTFLSRPEYAHVSSSMIRELLSINPELATKYYNF